MSHSCRRPDTLVFDTDIVHRWTVFQRDFEHYIAIAHPDATPAVQAHLLLNLAGPAAMDQYASFHFAAGEDRNDPQMQSLVQHTADDPALQQLTDVIRRGWPDRRSELPAGAVPYFLVRDELVLHAGVVVKGHKVVVPAALRDHYFQTAHSGHPGVEATLSHAQSQFYWPGMAQDIRDRVSACAACNTLHPHQQRQPLLQPPAPELPWMAVATDLFEWRGKHFLVLVDSYSSWFEVDQLTSITSAAVIGKLRRHFSTFGSPVTLRSDNGSQFSSDEFKTFAARWNFHHITSSPEYPQSNGLAERAVRSAKELLEHCRLFRADFHLALLNLRNISRDPALGSPAQRLMSRTTRPPLPVSQQSLKPSVQNPATVTERIVKKQVTQKRSFDKSARLLPRLFPGQVVRMQSPTGHYRLAVVVGDAGSPRSYFVDYEGAIYRRSRQHLLLVNEPAPPPADPSHPPISSRPPVAPHAPTTPRMPRTLPSQLSARSPASPVKPASPAKPTSPAKPLSPPAAPRSPPPASPAHPPAAVPSVPDDEEEGGLRTRSGRLVRPPVRYGELA
ncbi:uncharacterized protein LOC129697104 [Leucoraja erinacea]|uniref:uncharacterized protein LOC129697104 n=1 Tax=Leucoraja erinaceus TaxID=7782 RepID=UPI0024559DFA|nr:uncharacterized protein LOC129697104 [Leucoraja erinacea]